MIRSRNYCNRSVPPTIVLATSKNAFLIFKLESYVEDLLQKRDIADQELEKNRNDAAGKEEFVNFKD